MQATMGRRPVMRRKGDSKRPVIQVVLRGSAGLGLLLLFVIKEVVITEEVIQGKSQPIRLFEQDKEMKSA